MDSMGAAEPANIWDLLNGTYSKVDPVLSTRTRRSSFIEIGN